jgi:hypothetical protein
MHPNMNNTLFESSFINRRRVPWIQTRNFAGVSTGSKQKLREGQRAEQATHPNQDLRRPQAPVLGVIRHNPQQHRARVVQQAAVHGGPLVQQRQQVARVQLPHVHRRQRAVAMRKPCEFRVAL